MFPQESFLIEHFEGEYTPDLYLSTNITEGVFICQWPLPFHKSRFISEIIWLTIVENVCVKKTERNRNMD